MAREDSEDGGSELSEEKHRKHHKHKNHQHQHNAPQMYPQGAPVPMQMGMGGMGMGMGGMGNGGMGMGGMGMGGMGMGGGMGGGMGMGGMGMGLDGIMGGLGLQTQGQLRPVMPIFEPIEGVPTGLEPLYGIDSVHIQQQLEMIEIMFDVETKNRYDVVNNYGQRIFFAGEQSGFVERQCFGGGRPFVINLYDSQGRVAVKMERECNCSLCCWGTRIAGTNILVKSNFTGEVFGSVVQNCDYCSPSFDILDGTGKAIMSISGPSNGAACDCLMCGDATFSIYFKGGGGLVGTILKQFQIKELFSDANTFGIKFLPSLDPEMKVVLVAATFAIDYAFFESGGGAGSDNAAECSGCCCGQILAVLGVIVVIILCIYFFAIP